MKLAKILALLALAALSGGGARFFWLAGTAARELPDRADAALAREVAAARALVDKQTVALILAAQVEIQATRRALDARLGSIERTAASEVQAQGQAVLGAVDARLVQAIGVADEQLRAANATLAGEAARLNTSVAQVAAVGPPLALTAQQMAEAAPLWLNCDHNADCAFNRWVGTSRGVEKMAIAFGANAAPQQEALTGIAQDVHRATSEFTRKRTFPEKIWSGIKAIGGLAVLAAK